MTEQPRRCNQSVPNIFSCDVEDWHQSSHDFDAPISERVYRNVSRCLELLERNRTKGSFFVQGLVAEQRPEVVQLIDRAGHEIGSHGYSHRPVCAMTRDQFREEIRKTNDLLQSITGKPVAGFRAPDFTIFNDTHFAFDVLQECGFKYDSSIFPVRTGRYGNPGWYPGVSRIKGSPLVEFPVSVYFVAKIGLPVAGGGYVRLLPLLVLKRAVRAINAQGRPFVLYCHPYEFDPDEWSSIRTHISLLRKLHQGLGRRNFPSKVESLIRETHFCSFEQALELLPAIPEKESP
jgi:polysaccharide deacetylase family protein (PEP-CTERM system associated)